MPILQNAAEPEKNKRNLLIGYIFTFLTYLIVGIFGYFAFSGSNFKAIYKLQTEEKGLIGQNFLNMFHYDEVPAIIVRLMIYIQLSCSYPLINHFLRCLLMNLIWKHNDFEAIGDFKFILLNILIGTIPLMFALFYPKVGSILGYAASASGFLMIYVVPVVTYMKMKKVEIMNPLLAAAL